MSSDKLLIRLEPKQGYNKVFDLGEYNMNLTAFGVIQLANGTSYKASTGEYEVAPVIWGAAAEAMRRDGWTPDTIRHAGSVFLADPHISE